MNTEGSDLKIRPPKIVTLAYFCMMMFVSLSYIIVEVSINALQLRIAAPD